MAGNFRQNPADSQTSIKSAVTFLGLQNRHYP
jgi:hypothetical protein